MACDFTIHKSGMKMQRNSQSKRKDVEDANSIIP